MKREVTSKNSYFGKRAIVVGAGLSGLSVARVLSDHFDEVMIVDRDELPDDATPRPGVPQGKQPHALLGGGLKALENLFPGFGNQLRQAGAEPIDPGFDMLSEIPGQDAWPRIKLGLWTYSMSAPSDPNRLSGNQKCETPNRYNTVFLSRKQMATFHAGH